MKKRWHFATLWNPGGFSIKAKNLTNHLDFAVFLCSCVHGTSNHQAARMVCQWNDSQDTPAASPTRNCQELWRHSQLKNQLSSLNSTFTTSKTTFILTWNTCQITLMHPLSSSPWLNSVLMSGCFEGRIPVRGCQDGVMTEWRSWVRNTWR